MSSDFTLPSGRLIKTHEPSFGEYVDIVSSGAANAKDVIYAKFAVIVPELSREEVAGLSGRDGLALLREVSRIWEAVADEPAIPLGSGGQPSSTDSNPENSTPELLSDSTSTDAPSKPDA